MCVVSMVIDHYNDRWPRKYPTFPWPDNTPPIRQEGVDIPSKEEIEEFRELLERAREYDRRNNEPDCEMQDKKRMLKELAEKLGVDISFIDE